MTTTEAIAKATTVITAVCGETEIVAQVTADRGLLTVVWDDGEFATHELFGAEQALERRVRKIERDRVREIDRKDREFRRAARASE